MSHASAATRLSPHLVAAARLGDGAAITALLQVAQPDIRRYARASCRIDDVEDAVQDAMWLMTRRIGRLRAIAAFPAWMFTLVKRECLRLARKGIRGAAIEEIEDNLAFASRPELELRCDLTTAIEALPPHYRDIVLRRDVEELTIDEIAAVLALTREAVKARLHRARRLLREYLAD